MGSHTHVLAGSLVAHAGPLPNRDRPRGIPCGWPGRDLRHSTEDKGQGQGQGTRTQGQGLYHNYRFLGDHIPGGGIDLRAGGCALCVCSPLTPLYDG